MESKDIVELFSDLLDMIGDADLRAKVVAAWVLGCKKGNWKNVDQLKNMPFTLLTETHGVNFIEHTRAVTVGAYQLGMAQKNNYKALPYKLNVDRLIAGGILHDVGKLMEIEYADGGYRKSLSGKCNRHPISGSILAAEVGLGEDIINCICCHSSEGNNRPKNLETVLIHQADFATFDPLTMLKKGDLIQD